MMMPLVINNPTKLMTEKYVSAHKLVFIFMGNETVLLGKLRSQRVKQNRVQILFILIYNISLNLVLFVI